MTYVFLIYKDKDRFNSLKVVLVGVYKCTIIEKYQILVAIIKIGFFVCAMDIGYDNDHKGIPFSPRYFNHFRPLFPFVKFFIVFLCILMKITLGIHTYRNAFDNHFTATVCFDICL